MENLAKTISPPVAPTSSGTQIKDFLNSNNFVAKVSFLFLIIFVIIVLFQIIMRYLVYLYSPHKKVKLINGMVSASSMKTINQDMSQSPTMLVTPSTNKDGGIEFTWSVWIYIDTLETVSSTIATDGKIYYNVFFKGNYNPYSGTACTGLNIPNNAPGLYIVKDTGSNSAAIEVLMDTYTQASSYITTSTVIGGSVQTTCNIPNSVIVPHIPLDAWVNVVIRCTGNVLDVYVNGVIANSDNLVGVPKQNYGNVYVASNGGFNGNISDLTYMSYSASNKEIWNIYQKGPNTKSLDPELKDKPNGNFLSFGWYMAN